MKSASPRPDLSSVPKSHSSEPHRFALWVVCIVVPAVADTSAGTLITFEDLALPPESHWNGADGSGGFRSGGAAFGNTYTVYEGGAFWSGFAYSNKTDTSTHGVPGQFNAVAGSGQGGSATYGVAYVGWEEPPTLTLDRPQELQGLYVANNNFAFYDMSEGGPFSKQFGGDTGNDPDWFKLCITGKDTAGNTTGAVDFYLADFRFADSGQDYILDSWEFVDLTALGEVKSLQFALSSSDIDAFGMRTPAYFCIDTIIPRPAPPRGGPYTDPGIDGYIDPASWNHADPLEPNAVVNPIFRGWATGVGDYAPADQVWSGPGVWNDPNKALGPVTGDNFDIVSLGELNRQELDQGLPPGSVTLVFGDPCDPRGTAAIRNGQGYDFAVFENTFVSRMMTPLGSFMGQTIAELGYVEVSSNGRDFIRFPSVSLTPGLTGPYGTIEVSNVYNLAGKHPNAGGICTGTPFDLQELASHPYVLSGVVDVNSIRYVRIVDVPGSGDFLDAAVAHVAPGTWPRWKLYPENHPIYDAWPTWGSGGFDLEAIGVLHEQTYAGDVNLDGIVDWLDLDMLTRAWGSHFGEEDWNSRCDISPQKDLCIDASDFAVLAAQWGQVERWREQFMDE